MYQFQFGTLLVLIRGVFPILHLYILIPAIIMLMLNLDGIDSDGIRLGLALISLLVFVNRVYSIRIRAVPISIPACLIRILIGSQ